MTNAENRRPRLLFPSLAGFRKEWLRADVIAGLTVWAVVVPESLAYASLAGAPPVAGLYAAPAALVFYAMFGSSRHLMVGPMAATATLSAAAAAGVSGGADAATVTAAIALVAGVIALLAGLLRLGFVANFISEPVMKGFIVGLALTVMVGQVPKLLGIEAGSGDFFEKAWSALTGLGDADPLTAVVGLGTLAVVLLLRKFAPRVPASLVAAAGGILAVAALGLDDRGVAVIGSVPAGLPSIGLPDLPLEAYMSIAGAALGIVLVGFAEGLGAARTYATANHYDVDPNREMIGLGAANAAASFVGGMVVNGSLSKTAVNGSAGAHSQLSGITAAVLTVLTLLFLTGLFADLPEATLAAIVIAALVALVDFRSIATFRHAASSRLDRIHGRAAARPDLVASVATLLGVLIFDTLPGLFIGVALSFLLLLYRGSRPYVAELGQAGRTGEYADVARNPDHVTRPDVVVLRVESDLFFANSDNVRQRVLKEGLTNGVRAVVLDLATVPFIDVTAAKMLIELDEEFRGRRIAFALARQTGEVRGVVSRVSGTGESKEDGAGRPELAVYATVRDAVAAVAGPGADGGNGHSRGGSRQ